MVHRYPMIAYYLPWWIFWFLVSLPAHGFTMFSYSDRIGSLTPPSQRLPLLALETAGPRVMKTCVAALPFETLHLSELPSKKKSNPLETTERKQEYQPSGEAWNRRISASSTLKALNHLNPISRHLKRIQPVANTTGDDAEAQLSELIPPPWAGIDFTWKQLKPWDYENLNSFLWYPVVLNSFCSHPHEVDVGSSWIINDHHASCAEDLEWFA